MKIIRGFYNAVGMVSTWMAKIGSWVVVVIIISIVYEVFMRYALNSPTIWSWALSYMLGASFVGLGIAYTHYQQGNVRVDIFYCKLSPKARLVIDVFFTVFFFFPLFFVLSRALIDNALFAITSGEFDWSNIWYPKTWPYKSIVALGFSLLFIQGIAIFLKDVLSLFKGGKEPW